MSDGRISDLKRGDAEKYAGRLAQVALDIASESPNSPIFLRVARA